MKIMDLCRLGVSVTIPGMFSVNKVLWAHSSIAYILHLCSRGEYLGKKCLAYKVTNIYYLFIHMVLGMEHT